MHKYTLTNFFNKDNFHQNQRYQDLLFLVKIEQWVVGCILQHINPCELFNANSSLSIY